MDSLIVFSHLRWDCAWRRPQHLMSRLSRRWQVVFIEEPVPGSPRAELEVFEPMPGVQVWRPHVPGDANGFHDDHLPVLRQLLSAGVRERSVSNYWLWFYTPMALPLAADLRPRGIVYDCMEELALLADAPRQLAQRENALFKKADMVFAGGPGIYKAKRSRHPDVHCFPSSVDAQHFAQQAGEHPLHHDIPRPRLGYCGAIDGRVNLSLVDAIAKARPEWNIVMVGELALGVSDKLPRRDNIHWLGRQSYADLPRFIQGWDVCLLPYALNDATRLISPAKTLEYMACGKPAVSTSIRDVVEPYGHVVRVADTPEGFVADIEMLLARSQEEQQAHARELATIVARTSWDGTANSMAQLIAQVDELAESAHAVTPQPAVDERLAVPLHLADASQAVAQVARAQAAGSPSAAAG